MYVKTRCLTIICLILKPLEVRIPSIFVVLSIMFPEDLAFPDCGLRNKIKELFQ